MPHHAAHQHHHFVKEARDDHVNVVQSTVFVTAAKTFDGPVAGYSTAGLPEPSPAIVGGLQQNAQSLGDSNAASSSNNAQATQAAPSIVAPSSSADVSSLPSSIHTNIYPTHSSSATSVASSIDTAPTFTNALTSSSSVAADSGAASTNAPTAATPDQTSSQGTGMSSGAKAGLAIGLLALVAIMAAIAFFFYRRKQTKDARGEKLDDERSNWHNNQQAPGLVPRVSVRRTKGGVDAPRLSLRPVTEMFPPEMSEKQAAAAAAAGSLAAPAAAATRSKSPEVTNEKTNPFGDHAKLADVEDPSLAPKPLNISRPSTPTGARSESPALGSSAAMAGAKPPGTPTGPNGPLNVHRVQLDFAPSMDDELELRQGQLVRMLHEYDDGWALCIRLDRSQQGVVPRSCISKLPVKPRPGPPSGQNGQQQRRGPPPAVNNRPQGAGSPRMRSTSNAPQQGAGPFGEGQYRARSNTDGPGAQRPAYAASNLSNSPSNSPPTSPTPCQGPMPARKPVPGQAV